MNDRSELFPIVTRIPDVLKPATENLTEGDWKELKECILKGIEDLDNFRSTEGSSMGKDISKRIDLITKCSDEIAGLEDERTESVKSRIRNSLDESGVSNLNEDRFEQELIYYLEKFDITEEKTRLATHCNYFKETMEDENSSGKKLNFISQEIGREINTIGSKANHAGIQKLVVQMKDELEKIKEQLLNVL